jgi:hypothetical protein
MRFEQRLKPVGPRDSLLGLRGLEVQRVLRFGGAEVEAEAAVLRCGAGERLCERATT